VDIVSPHLRPPAQVASITLLDPVGLTKLDARFWFWLSIGGLACLTAMPLRRRLARWLDSQFMLEQDLVTLMWAASAGTGRSRSSTAGPPLPRTSVPPGPNPDSARGYGCP
jgi:hypothetical protein